MLRKLPRFTVPDMRAPTDNDDPTLHPDSSFLHGRSDMVTLIRSKDWSTTPLGPIDTWPQSLRTTVSLCLASNFPIDIIWGPEHTQIYNDGYRIVCGEKHPLSLGMDYKECWASAWPAIGQPFAQALRGETSFLENQRMFLFRNGYLEETFFTFSLSPIRDESGQIGGLFHPVTETTATMLSTRRTQAVRDLTARLGDAELTADVYRLTGETLAAFDLDLPFVLLYALDEQAHCYRLAQCTGVAPDTALTPAVLPIDEEGVWPVREMAAPSLAAHITGLRAQLAGVPCGPYPEAPDQAFFMPISQPGAALPVTLMMAGVSPRLPLTDHYRGLYDLLAAAFRAALARVAAAQAEHERAEKLAALDRAKTVFFSNISHEFRTPLTLMLGPLEAALDAGDIDDAQQERLQIARRNALRLLKMVNSMLYFSRVEAGRNEASFSATDLAALTTELASHFEPACLQAGVALVVDCPPLPQCVYVDVQMWEKIVLNLVSNAFKFTLAGTITVMLRERDGYARLTVSDTGVGIPATDLPHIFDRFHRVEGQQGRSVEGSGIGLALVRELVQLHGGDISVDSQAGRGSTFAVSIPCGSAHLPRERVREGAAMQHDGAQAQVYVDEAERWLPTAGEAAGVGQAAALQDRPRIVLADDNADMRAYVQRILEQGGYQVEAVGNGKLALDAIRRGPVPELVVSDVMMPELDGFALIAALRADPALQGTAVILLSARAGEEERLEGLAAGADDYLVKPFGARELRARVDGTVRLARQRRHAAAREQVLQVEIESERGQLALRRSEAHAAVLFEQTAVGMVELGLDGRLLQVNERFCQQVGRHRSELIGKRRDDLIHPDDLPHERALFATMLATLQPYEAQSRYSRPDGSCVWVSKTVTPIHTNGSKAPDRVLAVVLDITERRKAEQALKETADRLQFILAAAEIGDWDLDLATGHTVRSLRHDQCFGYAAPVKEWSYGTFMHHVYREDRERVAQTFLATTRDMGEFAVEFRVVWPDASVHWLAAHGSVHQTEARPTMSGIVLDITERKRAEEELREASRRKDEFLAMLAHELRNPLAPISAAAELMGVVQLTDERIKQTSEVIRRQVRHMTALIDDLLDVSRVTRGLIQIAKTRLDFNEIVLNAVEQVRPIIDARSHELVTEFAPGPEWVLGDQKRLVQVVTNLLSNAAKFTPDGGTIVLRTQAGPDTIVLTVQDTGIGIAPELQGRVFELFAQAERTPDRSQGGLGLGLALVKTMVELHGGWVSCHSDGLGKGSSFVVHLPRAAVIAALDADPHASGPHSKAANAQRILVVDDNEDAALMMKMLLEEAGHAVMVELDAHDALARAKLAVPDAAVLDIGLPDMDGNELARRLRDARETGHIKLIAVTGYGQEHDRRQSLAAGFDYHLVKPVDVDKLLALLEDAPPLHRHEVTLRGTVEK